VTIRPDIKHTMNCKMHCSWRINYTVLLKKIFLAHILLPLRFSLFTTFLLLLSFLQFSYLSKSHFSYRCCVLPTTRLQQRCLQSRLFLILALLQYTWLVFLHSACPNDEERINCSRRKISFHINRGSMRIVEHQMIYSPEEKNKQLSHNETL
jgi:hypothetical protein